VRFLDYARDADAFRAADGISPSDKVKLTGGTLAR
jgi:hypothetical protein